MPRFRARTVAATLIGAAVLVLTLRGQAPDARPSLQIADVGLPGIDEGVVWDESHTPSSDRARAARAAMAQTNAAGVPGRAYVPGKVIVSFRDNVTMDERRSLMREATDSGEFTTRSAYADFDIIRINPAEDPEAVGAPANGRCQGPYGEGADRGQSHVVPY